MNHFSTSLSPRLLPLAALALGLAPLAASAQSTTPTVITSVPYTISAGGNYIVGKNLINGSNGESPAISVNANNVNLDLNDYFVSGGGGSQAGAVIQINGKSGVMIKNGTLANGQTGVYYNTAAGLRNEMLEKVTITRCASVGVEADAAVVGAVASHCVLSNIGTSNGGYGLFLSGGWRVQDCVIDTVTGTGAAGIYSNANDLVVGNTISNVAEGIYYTSAQSTGKFLNNLLFNCPTPFINGVNATGSN